MAHYRFVTPWELDAPVAEVWDAVDQVEAWPQWWPGVQEARVVQRSAASRRVALRFRSRLLYSLGFEAEVVRARPPYAGQARVSGDLQGRARWELAEREGGTLLVWTWEVSLRVGWLSVLSVVVRPVLRWAHDDLMRRGRDGLAAHLGRSGRPTPPPPR